MLNILRIENKTIKTCNIKFNFKMNKLACISKAGRKAINFKMDKQDSNFQIGNNFQTRVRSKLTSVVVVPVPIHLGKYWRMRKRTYCVQCQTLAS